MYVIMYQLVQKAHKLEPTALKKVFGVKKKRPENVLEQKKGHIAGSLQLWRWSLPTLLSLAS